MAELSNTCFKWANHHGALVSLLDALLQREKLVDVTLAAEGQFINVHQFVLFASSKYFEDLLSQPHKPAVVFLKDVKFSDLKLLVDYMYHGEVNLPEDQLGTFFETAKALKIKGLPYESQPSQVEHSELVLHEQGNDGEMGGPIIDLDSVVSLREPDMQMDQENLMIEINEEEHLPLKQVGEADLIQQQNQDLLALDEVDSDLEVLSGEGQPVPIVFKQEQGEMIERDEAVADDGDRDLNSGNDEEMSGPILDPDSVVSLREQEMQMDQENGMIEIDEAFPFKQERAAADLIQLQDQDLLAPDEVNPDLELLRIEGEQQPAPIVFKQDQGEMIERDEAVPDDDIDINSNSSDYYELLHSDLSDEEELTPTTSNKSNRSSTRRLKNSKGKPNSNQNQASTQPAFKCGACGRDFRYQVLLDRHTLKKNCPSYFRCALCGTGISSRGHVKRHLSRNHENVTFSQYDDYIVEVNFTCSVCSRRYKDLASLQKHMKKKHDGGRREIVSI